MDWRTRVLIHKPQDTIKQDVLQSNLFMLRFTICCVQQLHMGPTVHVHSAWFWWKDNRPTRLKYGLVWLSSSCQMR